MSMRWKGRAVAAAVGLTGLLALAPVAGAAPNGYASGWPSKKPTDTGLITNADNWTQNTGTTACSNPSNSGYCVVHSWQVCIRGDTKTLPNIPEQQYNVPNCVPIATPWIETPPDQTKGWAIYCTGSTPYQQDGPWGGTQFWLESDSSGTSNIGTILTAGGTSSKVDYTAHNWSADIINKTKGTHYWGFYAACSNQPVDTYGLAPTPAGPYSAGMGANTPSFGQPLSATASSVGGAPRAIMAKGPAKRTIARNADFRETTWEADVKPRSTRTYTHSCPAGHSAAFRTAALGHYVTTSRGKVTMRERKRGRGTLSVTVKSGDIHQGDVRLQMHMGCVRDGKPVPKGVTPHE